LQNYREVAIFTVRSQMGRQIVSGIIRSKV
jgi:hypothetical protein